MTEHDAERGALEALLARHDGPDAWSALQEDGWLDVPPESDGSWPLIGTAATVAGVVARSGRPLPVGAQLAAAAALASAPDLGAGLALGVGVDLHVQDGQVVGRCWSGPAPDLLVVAITHDSLGLVRAGSFSLDRDPLPSFDEVDVRRLSFPMAAVEALGGPESVGAHEGRVAYFLAVEALAAAQQVTVRALEHLRSRRAFGQPLAAFQVLQHRAVDMHTVGLMGDSLLALAGAAWEDGRGGSAESWAAKLFAGGRGTWVAEEAIQLHGAIGFTWELGLHQALRRAQRARLLLGGPARAAAEVVAAADVEPRHGLTDWSLRPRGSHA